MPSSRSDPRATTQSPDDVRTLVRGVVDEWSAALLQIDEDDDASLARSTIENTQERIDCLVELGGVDDPKLLEELITLHAHLTAKIESEMKATSAASHELMTRRRTLRCYATPKETGQLVTGDA